MREEKLLDFIGQVDCKYIDEANCVEKRKTASWVRWCALAACMALCICGALAGFAVSQEYHKEAGYICLDVNPSFELCLNPKNIVISAVAYNEDGEKLLGNVDYEHKHYEDVIDQILRHDMFQAYLTRDLTITIVSNDDTEILRNIQGRLENAQCDGKVVCSDWQTREKAYSNHCSVGKYVAYEELSQYDEDVTVEDCQSMTMQELYEEIERHHAAHHDSQTGTENNNCGNTTSKHHYDHH